MIAIPRGDGVQYSHNTINYLEGVDDMAKWVCTVCSYVYDEAEGDPDHGVAAGTEFGKLPEDWVCPLCGVGQDMFQQE